MTNALEDENDKRESFIASFKGPAGIRGNAIFTGVDEAKGDLLQALEQKQEPLDNKESSIKIE